jgi:hypothetical protein
LVLSGLDQFGFTRKSRVRSAAPTHLDVEDGVAKRQLRNLDTSVFAGSDLEVDVAGMA